MNLDCKCLDSCDNIKQTVKDAVVRQWWVIFPNGGHHFYHCNLCDAVHHSNICKVDYMTKTSVMWSDQVSRTIRQWKKKMHSNWFLSDHQGGSFHCRWMFSTISHKVVLFDALLSVAVSNYCQVVKMLYCWKCLSIYLGVILAHYPNLVKHSHDVSPKVLPTMIPWYWLKTNDLGSHLPFRCFYLNPMGCNTKECCVCCINCPSIHSYWDGFQGLLYYHQCISNILCHEKC